MDLAGELIARLSAVPGCTRCAYAGSLRRMRDTIGDVDILAVTADPAALMAAFRELPLVAEVIASGDAKTSIRTTDGVQADLRVVPEGSWGAALQYFTGSQAHNVRLREMAIHRKQKLSEYGLYDAETGACIAAATEEVYAGAGGCRGSARRARTAGDRGRAGGESVPSPGRPTCAATRARITSRPG
jgi:DNA polymerase (family 10)